MNDMNAKWIWIRDEASENQRACFGAFFQAAGAEGPVTLEICAVTRYIVYLNGCEIGRGPIRSGSKELYYDTYSLDGRMKEGENYLAVRVWDHGWSTYQSLAKPAGVIFEVKQGADTLTASDETVFAALDEGHCSYAPKRNVNVGFTDYYDARRFDACWMEKPELAKQWPHAVLAEADRGVLDKKEIRSFTWRNQYPQHIAAVQQVKKGCQQITVNTRQAFFGDRRDADETTFSAFVGCELECPEDMEGIISFPNRAWNGLLGDFRIDGVLYEVTRANRAIPVSLKKGRHLFLMQISGKYDDLFFHVELQFPDSLKIAEQAEGRTFFAVGPTQQIISATDGFGTVYGGLDEFEKMEQETPEHDLIFASAALAEVVENAAAHKIPFVWVDPKYVMRDMYFLSLARTEKVLCEEAVGQQHLGILWANDEDTVLAVPDQGDYRRMIVDFGDIYIGSFEFLLKAGEGTIVDVYCFENMYGGEIDYTIGLNNGFRYVCREGWQRYQCMTRMGARYAMITVRGAKSDVQIRDFHIRHMTYSVSKRGEFLCDDFQLNRIWEMCCQTHELCMEDSFTDCPTYEQAFWIGDAQVTALINAYIHGDYEIIRHNLELAVTASENTKMMNALTPTDWNTSIPMWMMNWVISINQYMEMSGDETILNRLYDSVKATLHYYEEFIQPDGGFLINAWNMLDWAAMDIQNYDVVTGQQAILSWCYHLAATYAEKQGYPEDAKHFEEVRATLLRFIDQKMWDEEKQAYLDGWNPKRGLSRTVSIQTHVFLHLYHAITDERKRTITEKYLTETPDDFVKIGSPFMLNYLHEILNQYGKSEEVLQDIKERWGEMLHLDTTTCWEVFPGFYENSRTRSYCHSWSAAPVVFCLERILGIIRTGKGWSSIRVEIPDFAGGWCKGAVPTPHGIIRAWWERGKKTCRLMVPKEIQVDTEAIRDWNVTIIPLA